MLMRDRWDGAIGGISKLYIGRQMGLNPNMDMSRKFEAKVSRDVEAGSEESPEALAKT